MTTWIIRNTNGNGARKITAQHLRVEGGAAVFYDHETNPIAVYGLREFYVVKDRG